MISYQDVLDDMLKYLDASPNKDIPSLCWIVFCRKGTPVRPTEAVFQIYTDDVHEDAILEVTRDISQIEEGEVDMVLAVCEAEGELLRQALRIIGVIGLEHMARVVLDGDHKTFEFVSEVEPDLGLDNLSSN